MTIKEAVIKYIEYRHSLGEKFKSAGDTTDISSINMESVNSFLYKGNKVTAMWFARHTSLKGFFQWAFQRSLIETIPLTLDMPKRPAGLVPYIYSRDELSFGLYQENSECNHSLCISDNADYHVYDGTSHL